METNEFKVGDVVVRLADSQTLTVLREYEIISVRPSDGCFKLKGGGENYYDKNKFKLKGQLPVPEHITNQQPLMMQYFHTSVLVRDKENETSANVEYKELVPYEVRQALSLNDMRDTLVRELPKEVATTDCKFNIKAIFD